MAQDNLKEARQTYEGFITLAKWGTVVAALAAALVVMLIS